MVFSPCLIDERRGIPSLPPRKCLMLQDLRTNPEAHPMILAPRLTTGPLQTFVRSKSPRLSMSNLVTPEKLAKGLAIRFMSALPAGATYWLQRIVDAHRYEVLYERTAARLSPEASIGGGD